MSIFIKDSKKGEATFSVIEHRFNDCDIAFRYPESNFSPGSILFVQPGQEAVLIKEGDQEGPYSEGRYTLDTNNLPGLKKFFGRDYSKDVFNCYLYFINKERPVNVLWGTNHEIKVRDKDTGRIVRMFGRGSMGLSIENSLAFIAKTNGQAKSFSTEDIEDFIYDKSIEYIISGISSALQIKRISFLEIESHLNEISKEIKRRLVAERVFENFGLRLAEFAIEEININDEDFKKIQEEENEIEKLKHEADIEAYRIKATGFAESAVMKDKGIYYDKERTYDVLEAAASNESSIGNTGFIGAGVGLGVGMGVGSGIGSVIGGMAGNTLSGITHPVQTVTCSECGATNSPDSKFCNNCGKSLAMSSVICTSCNAQNSMSSKFCSNCGASLVPEKITCPACNAENDGKAKFCNSCGTQLNK